MYVVVVVGIKRKRKVYLLVPCRDNDVNACVWKWRHGSLEINHFAYPDALQDALVIKPWEAGITKNIQNIWFVTKEFKVYKHILYTHSNSV